MQPVKRILSFVVAISFLAISNHAYCEETAAAPPDVPPPVPPASGVRFIVGPTDLLDWPNDTPGVTPSITEPTSNRLEDVHGVIDNCDIAFSTAGNYYMALKELWPLYLHNYAEDLNIKTWLYTTSPPIAPAQLEEEILQSGNLNMKCRPQVAVGNQAIINELVSDQVTEGSAVPVLKSRGNVILVKKGNPRHISTIWDLGKPNITVITPNPDVEGGSFENFAGSIFGIAWYLEHSGNAPDGMTANILYNSIFNLSEKEACNGESGKCKWVTGKRIMHREIPWAINADKADAAVIFYHLALYFTQVFPDKFEIVPLGGTVSDPAPMLGNKTSLLKAVRIKGNWNEKQIAARERLVQALASPEFTQILNQRGMSRP